MADIAVFRDAIGRFELVLCEEIASPASKLESDIRQIIAG
jgi:hypothetical protein